MSASEAAALIVPDGIIQGDPQECAFQKIINLVHVRDKELYPDNTKQLSKVIRFSDTRMKMICSLNYRDVMECDRLCTFKIIATTKDTRQSARISSGVGKFCFEHSCQSDPALINLPRNTQKRGGGEMKKVPSGIKGFAGSKSTGSKKRKSVEIDQENYNSAWKILGNDKMFAENCYSEKTAYLDELGIFEATDMKELDDHHIDALSSLLKEIPRKKWLKFMANPKADKAAKTSDGA